MPVIHEDKLVAVEHWDGDSNSTITVTSRRGVAVTLYVARNGDVMVVSTGLMRITTRDGRPAVSVRRE